MSAKEIRDYVAQARQEPTTEHLEQLWRAVFLLQAWYFLPSREDEGPAYPTVSLLENDEPWILAFTNVRRIQEFARQAGRAKADGSVPLLVLDPLQSMEQILAVEGRVAGVVFNLNSEAMFRAPVAALRAYALHFGLPIEE